MAARDSLEERRVIALESIASSLAALNERAGLLGELATRALDYADRALFPGVMERALRAIPRAVNVRQVASVFRRASLLVGPGERDVLFAECARAAAACEGAAAFEGEAPSAAFVERFRAACASQPRPAAQPARPRR